MSIRIENDPYPGYDALLDESPVLWKEDAQMWFITGYDEAIQVGSDIERFSVRGGYRDSKGPEILKKITGKPLDRLSDGLMRFSDPPVWNKFRWIHEAVLPYKAFTGPDSEPPALRALFQELVSEQMNRVSGWATIDAMLEWCIRLPCLSTMAVLGIPSEDLPMMQEWVLNGVLIMFRQTTDWDFYSDESIERGNQAVEKLEEYFKDLFAKKKADPGDDFISRLLEYQKTSDTEITDYEVFQVTVNHMMGGFHESSMALLGDGIHLLLSTGQYKDVVDDPSLIPGSVEEMLRFHAYAPNALRVANEDVTVAGKTIKKGDMCLVNLGAAQRDPRKYENGRVFDIRRDGEANGSLTFGWGPHQCTGRPQIRLLAHVFFETLTKTYPNLRIPVWPESCYLRLRYQPRIDIVLLESLPLALGN